jgi:5'(3')-deoxyribonucleotidase
MTKVALDFDNVLADTMNAWLNIFNKRYSREIKKSDIIKWKFWPLLKIRRKTAYQIFNLVWENWEELPPIEENIASRVEKLSATSRVDIVTSARGDVKQWLKFQGIKYNELIYTKQKSNLKYDFFIDDSPDEALDLGREGKPCLLYDQPWNQENRETYVFSNHDAIFRITCIDEAIDHIGNTA